MAEKKWARAATSRDLIRDRGAAVAFHPGCEGWEDIRGLQMRGEVQPLQPVDD